MNRKKPYFLKRIIAYLIDLIIVVILSSIISTMFLNTENYQKELQKQVELMKNYTEEKITKEEYNTEMDNVTYYLAKDSVEVNLVTCGVAIVYYVILCFYCGGITLGKYIMKLKVVSASEKDINIGNFLLRSLFINMILSNLVSIVLVLTLNKETFTKIYSPVSTGLTVFMLVTVAVMMYREDGRGLHDLIANTMIISTKKDKEEVTEAKVIEEK